MASQPAADFEAELATVRDAVKITRMSKATLCRMRMHRSPDGPPWFRCGGKVFYPLAGLRQWAADRTAATVSGMC